jgi:hypothetical protein
LKTSIFLFSISFPIYLASLHSELVLYCYVTLKYDSVVRGMAEGRGNEGQRE